MAVDWIIEILRDIRKFAQNAGFAELAEHLDDSIFIATREASTHLDAIEPNDMRPD